MYKNISKAKNKHLFNYEKGIQRAQTEINKILRWLGFESLEDFDKSPEAQGYFFGGNKKIDLKKYNYK